MRKWFEGDRVKVKTESPGIMAHQKHGHVTIVVRRKHFPVYVQLDKPDGRLIAFDPHELEDE